MNSAAFKVPVHVEIAVKASCSLRTEGIISVTSDWIRRKCPIFQNGNITVDNEIAHIADSISVADLAPGKCVSFWQAELCLHPYRLSTQGPENDFMEGEEELPAAEQWELPNALLNNLWGSIVIDSVLKTRLLSYCSSSIRFSEAKIDTDIISWNRMILLHGPPGTGKTTICKGLAQKTFIRNSDRFSSGILLEVNSHSLFSKWFSESGKLVMKLFAHIAEIAEDEECMVVVLIDEVESITASRGSAARSNEPGDAVRVVNAVLTSLDALKRRPNVLVLCTSNLVDSVDPAFLDRVDLKVFLGPPPEQARYNILRSCLEELMNKGIIAPSEPLSADGLAVEQQLMARVLSSPLYSTHFTSNDAASVGISVNCGSHTQVHHANGPGKKGSAALRTARLKAEQTRNAQAALRAFIASVPVPRFDAAVLMDLEGMEDFYRHHDMCDANDVCLEGDGDGSDAVSMESSALEVPSQSNTQSNSSTQQSQELVSGVKEVRISSGITGPRSNGDGDGGCEDEEEEGEDDEEQEDLGLTPEQYLYVVAVLCQGMSGRSLRKLPIKAHSYYVQRPVVSVMEFLCAMHAVIVLERGNAED